MCSRKALSLGPDGVTILSRIALTPPGPRCVVSGVCIAGGIVAKGGDLPCPIDANGCFTQEVPDFAGMNVKDADKEICKALRAAGR